VYLLVNVLMRLLTPRLRVSLRALLRVRRSADFVFGMVGFRD
jgi:hypothetical protein